MGCHALLCGIFPIQGLNPGLLHCRQILNHLSHQKGSSYIIHKEQPGKECSEEVGESLCSQEGGWCLLYHPSSSGPQWPGEGHSYYRPLCDFLLECGAVPLCLCLIHIRPVGPSNCTVHKTDMGMWIKAGLWAIQRWLREGSRSLYFNFYLLSLAALGLYCCTGLL